MGISSGGMSAGAAGLDFSDGNVGVGTTTPDCALHVAGAFAASGPNETFVTFGNADPTPSVAGGNLCRSGTAAYTITRLDGGVAGQIITIISREAITYDVTGTTLKGGTVDIVTASGDVTTWVYDGTNWYLTNFMNVNTDLSGGH